MCVCSRIAYFADFLRAANSAAVPTDREVSYANGWPAFQEMGVYPSFIIFIIIIIMIIIIIIVW